MWVSSFTHNRLGEVGRLETSVSRQPESEKTQDEPEPLGTLAFLVSGHQTEGQGDNWGDDSLHQNTLEGWKDGLVEPRESKTIAQIPDVAQNDLEEELDSLRRPDQPDSECESQYSPAKFKMMVNLCQDCSRHFPDLSPFLSSCSCSCFSSPAFLSCVKLSLIQEGDRQSGRGGGGGRGGETVITMFE